MSTKDIHGDKKVLILMGSDSDLPVMKAAAEALAEFGVGCDVRVLSVHRAPAQALEAARTAREAGYRVIICGAGMAAHLGGAVASQTVLPVIGVPLESGALQGLDALCSTVQMPPGVPVATVAVDGAKNAAMLAARILALKFPEINLALEAASKKERARYDQTADEALAKLTEK